MSTEITFNGNQIKISTLGTGIVSSTSGVLGIDTSLSNLSTEIASLQQDLSFLQQTVDGLGNNSNSNSLTSFDQVAQEVVSVNTNGSSNFCKEWQTCVNAGQPNIVDICCSGDGRIVLVCPWVRGDPQLSTNYGETWSVPSGLSTMIWSATSSLDGSYIFVSDSNNLKVSTNYGQSFSLPSSRPYQVQSIAVSATAKYIVTACSNGQGVSTSSDFGASWIKRETSTWIWYGASCALDGSVMYIASDSGLIKKSTDYGNTWTTVYTDPSSRTFRSICCSGDGKYVLACLFNATNELVLSTDYGSTFSSVGSSQNYMKVVMSSNGAYMAGAVYGNSIRYSTDFGATWNSVSNNKFGTIAMSYNGETIYSVSADEKPLRSRLQSLVLNTSAPFIASAGSQYIDTATNKLYVYNGSAWKSVTLS